MGAHPAAKGNADIGVAPSGDIPLPQINAGSRDDRMAAATVLSLEIPVITDKDARTGDFLQVRTRIPRTRDAAARPAPRAL